MSIVKITSVFEIAKRGNAVNPFTIEEAELELSALREAGEKMARALRDMMADTGAWKNCEDAVTAWEAANK